MRITLEHVDYTYQQGLPTASQALHDISFSVESGEFIAIIGHGGSGKSTLALLLAGLYKPTAGKVCICEDTKHRPELFRSVNLVFQYPEQQMFGETVFEEVAFGAKNMGTPNDYLPLKVRQCLDEVGLDAEAVWHRSPFLLSGGQKRRVCMAGVLAVNPRVVILDEPGAGLDEGGRCWAMDMARTMRRRGKTVIWITHDMAEAAGLAERILVMDKGHLIADGTPEEVFAKEEMLFAAGLDIPVAAHVVRELKRRGADIPGVAITPETAALELQEWLSRGRPKAAEGEEAEAAPELSPFPEESRLMDMTADGLLLTPLDPSLADIGKTDAELEWEQQMAEKLRNMMEKEQISEKLQEQGGEADA